MVFLILFFIGIGFYGDWMSGYAYLHTYSYQLSVVYVGALFATTFEASRLYRRERRLRKVQEFIRYGPTLHAQLDLMNTNLKNRAQLVEEAAEDRLKLEQQGLQAFNRKKSYKALSRELDALFKFRERAFCTLYDEYKVIGEEIGINLMKKRSWIVYARESERNDLKQAS